MKRKAMTLENSVQQWNEGVRRMGVYRMKNQPKRVCTILYTTKNVNSLIHSGIKEDIPSMARSFEDDGADPPSKNESCKTAQDEWAKFPVQRLTFQPGAFDSLLVMG